jgi:hypothetical protein
MTRKRTPLEWGLTIGTIALVVWVQTPSFQMWFESMKWHLHQREAMARREEQINREFNRVLYKAWVALNYEGADE